MPGGHKNIGPEDGKKFSSEYQPANRGRKKKIYNILIESGYSNEDVHSVFHELIWYTSSMLEDYIKKESIPVILKGIAKQLLDYNKTGDYRKVKDLFEHIVGKPKQKTEISGPNGGPKRVDVTSDGKPLSYMQPIIKGLNPHKYKHLIDEDE